MSPSSFSAPGQSNWVRKCLFPQSMQRNIEVCLRSPTLQRRSGRGSDLLPPKDSWQTHPGQSHKPRKGRVTASGWLRDPDPKPTMHFQSHTFQCQRQAHPVTLRAPHRTADSKFIQFLASGPPGHFSDWGSSSHVRCEYKSMVANLFPFSDS